MRDWEVWLLGMLVALEGSRAVLCVPKSWAVMLVPQRQPVLVHIVDRLEKGADVLAGAMKCGIKTRDFRCPTRWHQSLPGVPWVYV